MSASSVSAWELTETYSPAASDIAPATKPESKARHPLALPVPRLYNALVESRGEFEDGFVTSWFAVVG